MNDKQIASLESGSLIRNRKSGCVAVYNGDESFHFRATPWLDFAIGRKALRGKWNWCYAATLLRTEPLIEAGVGTQP